MLVSIKQGERNREREIERERQRERERERERACETFRVTLAIKASNGRSFDLDSISLLGNLFFASDSLR